MPTLTSIRLLLIYLQFHWNKDVYKDCDTATVCKLHLKKIIGLGCILILTQTFK